VFLEGKLVPPPFIDCLLAAETYGRRVNFVQPRRSHASPAKVGARASVPPWIPSPTRSRSQRSARPHGFASPQYEGILTKFPPMGDDLLRG
jgi:hypothetical protein